MRSQTKRALAFGGVAGPVAFVPSWSVLGATTTAPHSPVHDAISRLAQLGAPSRAAVTIGFLTFGIGVCMFGVAPRDELPEHTWKSAVATGLATLAVGAAPLEASATVGYATFATKSRGHLR